MQKRTQISLLTFFLLLLFIIALYSGYQTGKTYRDWDENDKITKSFIIQESSFSISNSISYPYNWYFETLKPMDKNIFNTYRITSPNYEIIIEIQPKEIKTSKNILGVETTVKLEVLKKWLGYCPKYSENSSEGIYIEREEIDDLNIKYKQKIIDNINNNTVDINEFIVYNPYLLQKTEESTIWIADISVVYNGEEKDRELFLQITDKIIESLKIES